MDRHARHIVRAGAALWCSGIILAPLLAGSATADLLYAMYGVVCHQFPSRSGLIDGAPLAVCLRCSALYAAFTLMLFTRILRTPRTVSRAAIAGLLLPMAVDGLGSLFFLWDSTVVSRLVTGTLFGIGMALVLHEPLLGAVHSLLKR